MPYIWDLKRMYLWNNTCSYHCVNRIKIVEMRWNVISIEIEWQHLENIYHVSFWNMIKLNHDTFVKLLFALFSQGENLICLSPASDSWHYNVDQGSPSCNYFWGHTHYAAFIQGLEFFWCQLYNYIPNTMILIEGSKLFAGYKIPFFLNLILLTAIVLVSSIVLWYLIVVSC